MRYNRLHINQFGTLQNRTLDFSDHINIIRSSSDKDAVALCAFFEAMHFGMNPSDEDDLYARFYPEEGRSTYGGVLEFTQNEHVYSMFRNFRRDPQGLTLMDETSNRSDPLSEEEYQELMHHLTLPLYRDTLALNSLTAATSAELAAQLQQNITNLKTTGSASLDIEKTKRQLISDRISMEEQLSVEAEEKYEKSAATLEDLRAQCEKLPGIKDLPQGEDERNRLQTELTQLMHRNSQLNEEIQVHENILKEHSRYARISLKEAEDRCQRLLSRREKLLKHYPEPSTSIISRMSPVLTALFAVLALAGLFFGIYAMIKSQTTYGILGFLVMIVSVFFLPRMIRRWSSMRRFYYVDSELQDLYQEILADAPDYVTQDNLKDFIDTMNELKGHRRALAQCRKEARTVSEQLTSKQEQYKRLQEFLEEKRKDIIKKQLLQEQICRLEDEQENLLPVLERNDQIRQEIQAINTALTTIEELSNQAYRVFTNFLQENTSQLLSLLYEGKEIRLEIPEDAPATLIYNGRRAQLQQLDRGTLEQIYLLLRIACIQFFWKKDSLPILLDNRFCPCDETKFVRNLACLTSHCGIQFFVLANRNQEEQYLEKAGLPFTSIQL